MFAIKKVITAISISALLVSSAFAEDYSEIQAQLKKVVPNAPPAQITTSPLPGVYQVTVGPMVVYMTKDGKYLLNGDLIDLTTRENLTDAAKATARIAALVKIPKESMIVYPAKGTEKHHITVFTDVDCPYCVKLHKEIPALNAAGVSVHYLAYPRAGAGSPTYLKMESVWCAEDKLAAMDNALTGGAVESKQCSSPLQAHMEQAQAFGVNGTPNIVLQNGDLLPGYVPAKELLKVLK